ncbi:MAG TPA: hypothetical protein EYG73_09260 [Arcobacter sp.]|nr:hypothetical protein [Arcobacter sp.]
MKNVCYTAVSRDNFIRLYRYGNIKIIKNFIFSENENLKYNLESLLKDMQCEHDEDYVILKFLDFPKNNQYGQVLYDLKIQDIQQIYVLSQKAQGYYKPKFNPKLQFELYPDNILDELNKFNELNDMEKGIDIFMKKYDFIDKDKIEKELPSDLKKKFLEENNILSNEFESFYIDLLFYDRKNFLPKESIGYIFDIILITALIDRDTKLIAKFKQGQLKVENSSSYKKLDANKKDTLLEYIKFIEGSDDEDIKNFVAKIGDINYLITGSIFLMIKNLLLDKHADYLEEKFRVVNSFSSEYKEQLATALYLIGFIFGYKEFYEDYYDFLDLSIFKDINQDIVKEPTHDEHKIKRQELEDRPNEQKEKKEQKLLTSKTVSNSNFSENDSATNIVIEQNYSEAEKVESNENKENCITSEIAGKSEEEENKTLNMESTEDTSRDNKNKSIKDFLYNLDNKRLISIWSSASNIAPKELKDEDSEKLIENISVHESSCSEVKELLQTFNRDILAHILYSVYQKQKKNDTLKDLKTLDKAFLITKVLGEYNSSVKFNAN